MHIGWKHFKKYIFFIPERRLGLECLQYVCVYVCLPFCAAHISLATGLISMKIGMWDPRLPKSDFFLCVDPWENFLFAKAKIF